MSEPVDVSPKPPAPPVYLGDGVYASFDGYHIWLAVNHHLNRVLALDSETSQALYSYIGQLMGKGLV